MTQVPRSHSLVLYGRFCRSVLLIGAWVGLASSAQLGDGVEHYFSVTPLTWGR